MRASLSEINEAYKESSDDIQPDPFLTLVAWSSCMIIGILFWAFLLFLALNVS